MPEVLEVLLSQDSDLNKVYDTLSDGKKRGLIYSVKKIKNIDMQVQKIIDFLNEADQNQLQNKT